MSTSKQTQFDSEGFDLGATASDGEAEEGVVYEIGGGATTTTESQPKKAKESPAAAAAAAAPSPIDESERLKGLGNDDFKLGNHLDAYDYYTEAIEACPSGEGIGPTGRELLRLQDEFDEERREQAAERQRREADRRRAARSDPPPAADADGGEGDGGEGDSGEPAEPFSPPRHRHGAKLAVYHANRAAALLHLGRDGEVIDDCDVALLYNPTYAKAYSRRSTANERMENTEEALGDARRALELDPTNRAARKNVSRLEVIENERLEKLKEETMGKLKDLGNSILGNFGLSLDNFNAVQDPKSGGYSISFDQGKK